jgi:hypothetical protein
MPRVHEEREKSDQTERCHFGPAELIYPIEKVHEAHASRDADGHGMLSFFFVTEQISLHVGRFPETTFRQMNQWQEHIRSKKCDGWFGD